MLLAAHAPHGMAQPGGPPAPDPLGAAFVPAFPAALLLAQPPDALLPAAPPPGEQPAISAPPPPRPHATAPMRLLSTSLIQTYKIINQVRPGHRCPRAADR